MTADVRECALCHGPVIYRDGGLRHLTDACPATATAKDSDRTRRLERLTLKWRAQANRPQMAERPGERETLEQCADDLFRVILGGGG